VDRRDRLRHELVWRQIPEETQLQLLLGTLLGGASLLPEPEGIGFGLTLAPRHARLAEWTYEHLAPFVPAPAFGRTRVEIRAAPHPLFASVAPLLREPRRLRRQLAPAALWVWATHRRVVECEARERAGCDCVTRPRSAIPKRVF
jgi:hypothetical protein